MQRLIYTLPLIALYFVLGPLLLAYIVLFGLWLSEMGE
jgi:hypothetical protein